MDFLGSGLATPQETERRAPHGRTADRLLPQGKPRAGAEPDRPRRRSTSSPRLRRRRTRGSAASSPTSRAISALTLYVPDCDTTACSFSAATQFGSQDPILDQPLIDFYAGYQIGRGNNREMLTVPINDNIEFDGGIVTWIENMAGDRPYGNDLDPTLNLDVLELGFRNCERWKIDRFAAAAGDDPQDHPFPAAAGRDRRVRRPALAHLLSAGAVLRLFRPLLCRAPCAAAARSRTRSIRTAASS